MTLISNLKINFILLGPLLLLLWLWPAVSLAQADDLNAVSLSVTPTLFEMVAMPEQIWNSNVKVINNNRFPLTVYANAVNFAPQGETGQGKFLPVIEEMTEGTTLAEWIEITAEPILLGPGESKQVPFVVRVPKDVTPGGHFAAILIGTRPPDTGASFQVKTAQIVTSLFLLRVAGDVIEDGSIREFRTLKAFQSTPVVDFEVRFENKGNVHIQPQGSIIIKNMWGKERGTIPINHQTHFGNVLPESIRKFEFTWRGESSFSDFGRYSAELTLGYGSEVRKFATSKTYFWVVPVKPLLITLGIVVVAILFILWAVKAYVRRMLALEGYQPHAHRNNTSFKREGDILIERRGQLDAPVRAGWLDLQARLDQAVAFLDTLKVLAVFVWTYKKFFGSVLLTIIFLTLFGLFITSATKDTRDYEVTISNPDADVTLSSEEIIYEQQNSDIPPPLTATTSQAYELIIVNSSDTAGQAAALQRQLEPDYAVAKLESDLGAAKERSVIVYHTDLQAEALALREKLGNFILSALPPESEERTITIYIGNDYESR